MDRDRLSYWQLPKTCANVRAMPDDREPAVLTLYIENARVIAAGDMRDRVLELLRSYDVMSVLPMTAEVLLETLIERISAKGFGQPRDQTE